MIPQTFVEEIRRPRHLAALFAATSFVVLLLTPVILVPILLCLVSVAKPQLRRPILGLNCLVSLFLINSFGRTFSLEPMHLLPFLLFNFCFVLAIDRSAFLKRNYLVALSVIGLSIILIQGFVWTNSVHAREATLMTAPIIVNLWTYANYAKNSLPKLTFWERVIWLRPFWFRWILPYGTNSQIQDALVAPSRINFRRLERYALALAITSGGMFLFENLVFARPEVWPSVDWVPHVLQLPLTYRDGFHVFFERYPVSENFSQLQQSLTFLVAQSLATMQFLFIIGLYSTAAIITAVLAGFDIELHVKDFWNARTFSDFYFRTNFYYSNLIRHHLMPVFARLRFPLISGRLKQAWIIFASVFIVSEISLYIGRGLWLGSSVGFTGRTDRFFENYHYALITATLCSLHVLFRNKKRSLSVSPVADRAKQLLRVITYFFLFQFSLIFGFHYLKSEPATKILYATVILKLFHPDTYLSAPSTKLP